MSRITYLVGDATAPSTPGPRIIAHVCNDIGGWGRGFVMAVSQRWPAPEAGFREWYAGRESNDFALGNVQFVAVEDDLWVANMIAQQGIKRAADGTPPIRYEAVEAGLARIAAFAVDHGATVHMPRIGCGLAGGRWEEIEPLIERTCIAAGVDVFVYDFAPSGN
ncbi:MAG: macro domain-containing protein [Planctomycetota bacterium]